MLHIDRLGVFDDPGITCAYFLTASGKLQVGPFFPSLKISSDVRQLRFISKPDTFASSNVLPCIANQGDEILLTEAGSEAAASAAHIQIEAVAIADMGAQAAHTYLFVSIISCDSS